MKNLFLSLLLSILTFAQGSSDFDNYFKDETLRIDYFHIGDAKSEMVTIDKFSVMEFGRAV